MNIIEAEKSKIKKTIVVYSGRFQPFHKGHYATYDHLVNKFGKDNVYIGTSNVTDSNKSPFGFNEKKSIMQKMFGIPSNKIVQIKNPYAPEEVLNKFDSDTTAFVTVVGEKDASRLKGKYFKPFKGKVDSGYIDTGYVYVAPAQPNPISGTDVRQNMGGADEDKAIAFFKTAYPKFDKNIFSLIRKKLVKEDIKVGVDVGDTVLMGKFKNKKVKVKDISTDSHGMPTINGRQATTFRTNNKLELYNPILKIIGEEALQDTFNKFISEYMGESDEPNPIMDKEVQYTNTAGEKKKIKVRAALRLPKDHPAHIEAEKLTKSDKEQTPQEKPEAPAKETPSDKPDTKSEPDTDTQTQPEPEQNPQALSGAELKSTAEIPKADREAEARSKETKSEIESELKDMSDDDKNTIEAVNNPQSPQRKSMMDNIKSGIKQFGKGIKHWAQHKVEMVNGTVDAVKALANGKKIGSVRNKETGKWEYSDDNRKKQLKNVKHFALDVGLLVGSMALGGAGVAATKAVMAGKGVGGALSAAGHGAVDVFMHGVGGFGAHLGKDIAKHAALETLGFGGAQAATGGAALSTATMGLLEVSSIEGGNNKFLKNFLEKVIKRMETYKLSDEQLLKSIKDYKSKAKQRNAAQLVKESITSTKVKSINHFVEYATKRLKLNERPKINLVGGGQFAESQTSLGGYDDNTKEIFVSTEGRLTADILRTIAHEMVHRKQDEMGIIKDRVEDGKTGSPVENKAHAVAGILMREYGKLNKKIFQEGKINEATSIEGAFNDDQPDGMFLAKGMKRKLGAADGINKSDEWFTNGGYIQIDFPTADTIFGDDEQDQPYVIWRVKNLPRTDFKPTKFNKKNFVNEHRVVSLLKEGGAYGHMSHPFDDMGLTFGDLKRIVSGALNGHLELAREKTDGQALAISWKNGRLIAARNKGHLANAGANAMGIEDVASKFAGRGGLTDAYNFAMKDLNAAISGLSEKQKQKIFGNGKCFMNIEVIWPESVNVIPYGQALLVFHNTTCYDESGTAISADQPSARILAGMIKQINANIQSKYTIQGPPILELPKKQELSNRQGYWFGKLNKLQSQFKLSDSASVSDYHYAWWADFIDKQSPVKPDKLTKEALIRRWGFGEKSFRLNTISDKTLQDWAIQNDKVNVPKQQKDNIKPFEEIFLGVGSEVLQFVTSVLTVHPDKAIRAMKDKLEVVAKKVKESGDPSIIKKFKNELERLNSLGGVDKIVAAEGIVFVYNGKTYKWTGTFAALNQLLGIFYK